jgi:hypothetical protein
MHITRTTLIPRVVVVLLGCSKSNAPGDPVTVDPAKPAEFNRAIAQSQEVSVDADSFQCLHDITAIRHLFKVESTGANCPPK